MHPIFNGEKVSRRYYPLRTYVRNGMINSPRIWRAWLAVRRFPANAAAQKQRIRSLPNRFRATAIARKQRIISNLRNQFRANVAAQKQCISSLCNQFCAIVVDQKQHIISLCNQFHANAAAQKQRIIGLGNRFRASAAARKQRVISLCNQFHANAVAQKQRVSNNLRNRWLLMHAGVLIDRHPQTALLITPMLRPRELKIACALRMAGWKTILLYRGDTSFDPLQYFDIVIKMLSDSNIHKAAYMLQPRICHVFSGAIDNLALQMVRDKPAPVIIDLNDIFTKTLFNAMQERFEPTLEAITRADAFCARDLQLKYVERGENISLPNHILLFQEYCWRKAPVLNKKDPGEVHVVSVGTFTLESQGMYDSAQLEIARKLVAKKIHFHIYPHWFYRRDNGVLADHFANDFRDFLELERRSPYLHVHESLPIEKLAEILPSYDFGIIAGGAERLGQKLAYLSENYMRSCYSGRIADFLDARLPVLINREVAYNFRLLKHYGVAVDLDLILEADFRERLLAIKHDPTMKQSLEKAAFRLSINLQSRRIGTFYERVIGAVPARRLRLPWIGRLRTVPVVSHIILAFSREINAAHIEALGVVQVQEGAKGNPLSSYALEHLQMANQQLQERFQRLKNEISLGNNTLDEVSGLLNWPEISDESQRMNGFTALLRMITISGAHASNNVSAAWEALGQKHFDELLVYGYQSFKRTIALNYFTFPINAGDPQLTAVERLVTPQDIDFAKKSANVQADDPDLKLLSQWHYRYFTALLWIYARKIDFMNHSTRLSEPSEGRPITVKVGDQTTTQDLANSLIEYYAMLEHVPMGTLVNVLEIGGGYGRNAFVASTLHPHVKYIMVDIPPALYIAQRYLSSVFPERRIFHVQDFSGFSQVKEAFDEAKFVFLLPHQLALLPDKLVDLVINISSFGEMTERQVADYFFHTDRVCRGFFYFKQWKTSPNPFDKLELGERDYPLKPHWRELYHRECAVQTQFFEALYAMGESPLGGDR